MKKTRLIPYTLILPALISYVTWHVIPIIGVMRLSLFKTNYVRTKWVGLKHYIDMFSDPEFLNALGNSVLYVVLVVPANLAIAVGVALMIFNTKENYQTYVKTLVYLPGFIGALILSATWAWIFSADLGLANQISVMLINKRVPWFSTRILSVLPICIAHVVTGAGGGVILFNASMKAIPSNVIDAAMIDGCNWPKIKLRILLPNIRGTVVLVALVQTIATLQLYYWIRFLAPFDYASNLMFRMMQLAFQYNKYGKGSAQAVVLMLIIMCIAWFQFRLMRKAK